MSQEVLKIEGLSVGVDGRKILDKVDLTINEGEVHVLMGPNGAGKSTLGYALMGNPKYEILEGKVTFKGEDLLEKSVDKRAKAGLFLSFQSPQEIPGVTLADFIRSGMEAKGERVSLYKFKKNVKSDLELLNMDASYLDRDLNVGFSGGEKKKAEILQLLCLKPALAILDETDSGLDVDAVRTVSAGVEAYKKNHNGALLIITHSTKILEALSVDRTHVLVGGHIAAEGGPELVDEINENGFEKYLNN